MDNEDVKSFTKLMNDAGRITLGYSWIVFDTDTLRWVAYQRKPRQKYTRTVYNGKYLSSAIERMIEAED